MNKIYIIIFVIILSAHFSYGDERSDALSAMDDALGKAKFINFIFEGKVKKIRMLRFYEQNILLTIINQGFLLDYKASIKINSVLKGDKNNKRIKLVYGDAYCESKILNVNYDYLMITYSSWNYLCWYEIMGWEGRDTQGNLLNYFYAMKVEGKDLLLPVYVHNGTAQCEINNKSKFLRLPEERGELKYIRLPYNDVINVIQKHVPLYR